MIEDFARVLREKLREIRQTELDGLARGAAKDFAAYQYSCGVLRGIELAEQEIHDLLMAVREGDDQ